MKTTAVPFPVLLSRWGLPEWAIGMDMVASVIGSSFRWAAAKLGFVLKGIVTKACVAIAGQAVAADRAGPAMLALAGHRSHLLRRIYAGCTAPDGELIATDNGASLWPLPKR
jgi:hypothetical protein